MASTKTTRGAKAPRSSFRTTSKAKASRAPAKARTIKPPAKASAPKATPAKARTVRTIKPKPAKASASAKPRAAPLPAPASNAIALGELVVPSGTLAMFDVGLLGYLPREALEPAMVKVEVPRDRPLAVTGTRVGSGRFGDRWDHVSIILGDGEVAHAKKLGKAGVDFARLMLIDLGALDHWQHEDSLDGKADFVFWGRDEQILARVMGAPRLPDCFGWTDLSLADAEAKADQADRKKAENKWAIQLDLRPHTHHFKALAATRASKHGAGVLELAGSQLVLLSTTWGEGVFPIYLESDAQQRPVRVRIQLATVESNAAKR